MENKMFTYTAVNRTIGFKQSYLYKIHFKANVQWSDKNEHWRSEEDKEYMTEVEEYFNLRNPGETKRQGAVLYCKDIETAYMARMLFEDKILKIEKAIINV